MMLLFGLCFLFVNIVYSVGIYSEMQQFLSIRELIDVLFQFLDRYSELCNYSNVNECAHHNSILDSINRFQIFSGLILVLFLFPFSFLTNVRRQVLLKGSLSKPFFDSSIAHHQMLVMLVFCILFFFVLTWLFPNVEGHRWFVRAISQLYIINGGFWGVTLDFVFYFSAFTCLYNALHVIVSWLRFSLRGDE